MTAEEVIELADIARELVDGHDRVLDEGLRQHGADSTFRS